jgi:hypothetical protein
MKRQRRVTLRCLVEDLVADWADESQHRAVVSLRDKVGDVVTGRAKDSSLGRDLRAQPGVNMLAHPLVTHFENQFAATGDHQRENIGNLTDPHWWKQKTGRWRGAASDHSRVGEGAWLCAGGRRTAGSSDDFYAVFKSNVVSYGPEAYLPADEDLALLRAESKVHLLDAWRLQLQMMANVLLADSAGHFGTTVGPVAVTTPSLSERGDTLAHVSMNVDEIVAGGDTLYACLLIVEPSVSANPLFVSQLVEAMTAAVEVDPAEWRLAIHGPDGRATSHEVALDEGHLARARATRDRGHLVEEEAPRRLTLGVQAHYSPQERLADASVEGSPVEAICGYWFVPTVDHQNREVCADCEEGLGTLKQ